MLSVVIADDEKGIIELIKHLIDPEQVQVQIVGEAGSGLEAYEIIRAKKPDVVITDIRMPGMSGIDLLSRRAAEYPDVSFVMISGFQEFAYAQTALKYGAVDYLLKPINRNLLSDALMRIDKAHSQKAAEQERMMKESISLENSIRLIRRQALQGLAGGIGGVPDVFRQESVFDQSAGCFCVGIVRLVDTSDANQMVSDDTAGILMEKIQRCLAPDCLDIETTVKGSVGYLYLHYAQERTSLSAMADKLRREIYNTDYVYERLDITIGLGAQKRNFEGLTESYRSAQRAVRSRIDLDAGDVLLYRPGQQENQEQFLLQADRAELKKSVEQLDERELAARIEAILKRWQEKNISSAGLYELAARIVHIVLHELQETIPECPIPEEQGVIDRIENCIDAEGILRVCVRELSGAVRQGSDIQSLRVSTPIRKICRYMQDHLNEQLSLKDLAKLVTLSPVYVSMIFKKEMGVSLSSYFTELRMNKAKELLKNSPMSIAAIAEAVGYQDTRYFSRLFIKTVGIRPVDYRKFYS